MVRLLLNVAFVRVSVLADDHVEAQIFANNWFALKV